MPGSGSERSGPGPGAGPSSEGRRRRRLQVPEWAGAAPNVRDPSARLWPPAAAGRERAERVCVSPWGRLGLGTLGAVPAPGSGPPTQALASLSGTCSAHLSVCHLPACPPAGAGARGQGPSSPTKPEQEAVGSPGQGCRPQGPRLCPSGWAAWRGSTVCGPDRLPWGGHGGHSAPGPLWPLRPYPSPALFQGSICKPSQKGSRAGEQRRQVIPAVAQLPCSPAPLGLARCRCRDPSHFCFVTAGVTSFWG